MSDPYADAYALYWQAGWRGILPLPYAKKKNPPAGFTGATGTDPTFPDVHAWADGTGGKHNICLRMPANIIGIDVDAYGDKSGAITLAAREEQWGPLPPTWRTTSRDDGVSGIRLYRIPEGLAWPGVVGPGIETVRRDHRYAVAWPSVHPEGGTYRWIDADGITTTNVVPDPDTLPLLPPAWVEGLTAGVIATEVERNTMAEDKTMLWIVRLPRATEDMCARMAKAVHQAVKDIDGGAHDGATAGAARVLRLGAERHRGVVGAVKGVRDAFINEVTRKDRALLGKAPRSPDEADREWRAILRSGVNLVSATPSDIDSCDCDGSLTAGIVAAATTNDDPDTSVADTDTGHDQLRDGAAFILDAPERPPALWGYGSEVLWAEGESLMIAGPPGVGKTTLTGQLLRCRLGLQEALLGWGVTPTSSRILYLAMDRPAQIARSLRRHFTEDDRDHLTNRPPVWEGPPPGDLAANPGVLHALATLADADTIIIDSVKDAAIGLSDDETGAGYNRARQTALSKGVQVIELHHQTKRGPNGTKPTQLADVYGSAWITAGAGSVVLLWGQAGDPVVTMTRLKRPADDVGRLTIIHDHAAGISTLDSAVADLPTLLIANQADGLTAKAAAAHIYGAEDPDANQVEKMRRRLNGLVQDGLATRKDGARGGTHTAKTRYFPPVDNSHKAQKLGGKSNHDPITPITDKSPARRKSNHESNHADPVDNPITIQSRSITENADSCLEIQSRSNHANHASPQSREHPPLGGGVHASDAAADVNDETHLNACDTCGLPSITNPCSTCRNQGRA